LEKRNCLKKEGNLYILNKIDRYTKGGNPIEDFQLAFYEDFEDEKKTGDIKININFSSNTFVPLISLLYQAETKYEDDFYSMLLVELFQYLDNNLGTESFLDFIEKRLDVIIKKNNIDNNKIEDEMENINKEELKIIKESSNKINSEELKATLVTNKPIDLEFKKKEVKEILKKYYVIHKYKMNKNYCFSEAYYDLEDFIGNIKYDSYNLPSPPPIKPEVNDNKHSIQLLQELKSFINEKLKGRYNKLSSSLTAINESLIGTKIRISFIGNISAGKSTIINSIVGQEILPSKDGECTYRAVIIKHRNINKFKLYKAKLEIVGKETSSEYYNFKEEDYPYCEGIDQIKSYLNNKNNDKKIDNNDAFIVIHGRLKIFDFIKLDKKYLNKVEFVDLPGLNKKTNTFIQKNGNELSFYDKVIQFTNSIIFVCEPDSNDDENNVIDMQTEYNRNKLKLDNKLQNKAIDTCIFVINKSDLLSSDKQKEKLKGKLKQYIKEVEPNIPSQWDNIAFFSGKCFNECLIYYKRYVEFLDTKPILLLKLLYKEWSKKFSILKISKAI
jgi:predicted GTPase